MISGNNHLKNSEQSQNNREIARDRNTPYQTTKAKPQLAIKSSYSQTSTQNNKYSQDSVRNYLQTIGRIPLLSGEEEVKFSRQVADLLQLEQIRQQLAEKLGRQPSKQEWAREVNMMLPEFRRRLYLARQAKNKMIQANLRLVVFIAKQYLKRGLSLQDLIQSLIESTHV